MTVSCRVYFYGSSMESPTVDVLSLNARVCKDMGPKMFYYFSDFVLFWFTRIHTISVGEERLTQVFDAPNGHKFMMKLPWTRWKMFWYISGGPLVYRPLGCPHKTLAELIELASFSVMQHPVVFQPLEIYSNWLQNKQNKRNKAIKPIPFTFLTKQRYRPLLHVLTHSKIQREREPFAVWWGLGTVPGVTGSSLADSVSWSTRSDWS